jgi:hypothetical protein
MSCESDSDLAEHNNLVKQRASQKLSTNLCPISSPCKDPRSNIKVLELARGAGFPRRDELTDEPMTD